MDNVEYIQQEYEWSDLPWKKFEKALYKLQKRIYNLWENGIAFATSKGVPQGGVISPLLANIALHGMENCIKSFAETLDIRRPENSNYQVSKTNKRSSLSFIRYADDFIILHKDHSVVQRCKELISAWLNDMGLELKPSKTRITHTLHNVGKEKAGFDFLGFNIRQYNTGKYTCGKNSQNENLGFKTIIKPSKESILKHYRELKSIIKSSSAMKQSELIGRLNPVIIGWCNYFSKVASKKAFKFLDNIVKWKLWKWGVRRHRKGKTWLKSKYFQNEVYYDNKKNKFISRDWIFATTVDGNIHQRIIFHADKEINRYVKVKGSASPYDGNLIYWSSRMGKNPLMPTRKSNLLKNQKGKCNWCKLRFKHNDILEVDHIIPKSKGGTDYYKNLQLLHRHCHDKKTLIDGSNDSPFKPAKLPQG